MHLTLVCMWAREKRVTEGGKTQNRGRENSLKSRQSEQGKTWDIEFFREA